MAEKVKEIRDIRKNPTGAYFDVAGGRIQTAIRVKLNDHFDPQIKGGLERIVDLIPTAPLETARILCAFANLESPADLAPRAAELYQLCRHVEQITQEVADLQLIGRNLYTDDIYRLGVEEIKRFGL